jgi:hypothetical protein
VLCPVGIASAIALSTVSNDSGADLTWYVKFLNGKGDNPPELRAPKHTQFAKLPKKPRGYLTAQQDLAWSILRKLYVNSRVNLKCPAWELFYKWATGARRASKKFAVLHAEVNAELTAMKKRGELSGSIIYWEPKDPTHRSESYPETVSLETVRLAWIKSDMRELQLWANELSHHYPLSH